MDEATLKYKRQVRDHYNKHVCDKAVIDKVADVIDFPRPKGKITWRNILTWKNIK
jgi:hypothetical protein